MNKIKNPTTRDNLMWDIWMSSYHLSIITVADKLNLFTSLKNKKLSLDQLADKMQINKRSAEILAAPLVELGQLIKRKNLFDLTETARTYLLPESSFYWGAILEVQRQRDEYKRIMQAIHSGSNQLSFGNKTFTDMWKEGSITLEAASNFTQKMHATIFAPALAAIKSGLFKSTKKLLDVGGGSGCFSVAYIQQYPESESAVFELPPVCEITKQYIEKFALSHKISLHPGNFFTKSNWPTGYDGILLSQILHDWPIEDCKKILKIAYDLLPTNGKIYIHEMILNETRVSPLTSACFDLLMFVNHQSQQFTKTELFDLLKDIGFKMVKIKKTFGYFSLAIATK